MNNTKRTPKQIRQSAYRQARNYMKLMGRPVKYALMSKQDRNLFQFTRDINESVLIKINK